MILKSVDDHKNAQLVKKGVNECLKSLSNGSAALVVIGSDTYPIELCLSLPASCEDKGIPYVFVPSGHALARACGLTKKIISCVLLKDERNTLSSTILRISERINTINL